MTTTKEEKKVVLLSAPSTGTKARASSILQRNAKVYGPNNALKDDSSCWNSEGSSNNDDDDDDKSTSHWFRLDFGRVVQPTAIALQFQAGFCAAEGRIECQIINDNGGNKDSDTWIIVDNAVEWQDVHELQTLTWKKQEQVPPCQALRIVLEECADFYGRVILYQVQVWGTEQTDSTSLTTEEEESAQE